ncbi:MAG: transposase [Methanosarcinales archaeon]
MLLLILTIAQRTKNLFEIYNELKPKWSGYLGFDGKVIKIHGHRYILLVAVDLVTLDLVFFKIVKHESKIAIKSFLETIKIRLNFPFKGIVADLALANIYAIQDVLPEIPFQGCVVHLERDVNLFILPKYKRTADQKRAKHLFRKVIYARSKRLAIKAYLELIKLSKNSNDKKITNLVNLIRTNFDYLFVHHKYPFLDRDNNKTENVINQLNEKFILMKGFKKLTNAYFYIKLITLWYKFKRFETSKDKSKNGKSPMELSNCKSYPNDWVEFCFKGK